jgi:flagellar hook-associated protein 3 FlgL
MGVVTRVSNQILFNSLVTNAGRNVLEVNRLQEQVSNQRRINQPSDDPTGVAKAMKLRTEIDLIEQFKGNIDDGLEWLKVTDTALDQAGAIVQRARLLAVQGKTGTLTDQDRTNIAAELDQLIGEIVGVANTSVRSRFIFAGNKVSTKPYQESTQIDRIVSVSYRGDAGVFHRKVGEGQIVDINTPGSRVFEANFSALISLRDNLRQGQTGKMDQDIENLDKLLNGILKERALVGAKMNRLEGEKKRVVDFNVVANELLVGAERANITDNTEAIALLEASRIAYQASLQAGANVIQPTLLNFIR